MTRAEANSTTSRLPSPTLGGLVNVLVIVVLIAVVAPFVIYSMPAVVGADHSFVVLSGSMEPEIAPGDVVLVSDATQRQIERGDVITFMRSDAEVPTTHRVVEVNQREDGVAYTTKGDANEDPDPQGVRPAQVIGEVTYVIPLIGYVVQFANTQTGFLVLIGLPLGLLVVNEAWSILRTGNDETGGDERTSGDESGVAAAPDAPRAADAATTPAVTTADSVAAESGTADSATTAQRAAASATGDSGGTESAAATTATYTVTRSDLRLSMVILSVFAVYATWTALQETSGVTVTAAVGSGAGVVICGAIYYAAGGDDGSSSASTVADLDDPGDDDDDGGAVTGAGPDDGGSAGARVGRPTPEPVVDDSSSAVDSTGGESPPTVGPPVVRSSEQPENSSATGDETAASHGPEATNGTGVVDETAEVVSASSDDADQPAESGDGGEER